MTRRSHCRRSTSSWQKTSSAARALHACCAAIAMCGRSMKTRLALILVKIAQLAADLPEVRDLDINPLLADASGLLALDARVAVAPMEADVKGPGHPRFAVRPYPSEWERTLSLSDGRRIVARPIRPEDEALYPQFLEQVSAQDLRLRFFAPMREFSHAFIARLTQIDYARAMAFVAIDAASHNLLGVVRLHSDANYQSGRVCDPAAFRPEGPRARLATDAIDHCLRQERGAEANRRPGADREHGHAAHVRGAWLSRCA